MSSLLWSLQRPDGKESWLFGSMHIRDDRVHQLGERLYPLILQSDKFIGEMELNPPPPGMKMPAYDLKSHFTEKVFQKMRDQLLKSFGVDIDLFAHVHPLMLISSLSQSILEADHQVSLDEHLWRFAQVNHLEVGGLESYEEQLKILHSIDPGGLYRQVHKISKSPSGLRRQTLRALEWYMKGDVHKLYLLTKSSMHKLRKSVIYERNQQMSLRIHALPAELTYFIVIGAGHLSGKFGVIPLLKQSGWKVKPVDLSM